MKRLITWIVDKHLVLILNKSYDSVRNRWTNHGKGQEKEVWVEKEVWEKKKCEMSIKQIKDT